MNKKDQEALMNALITKVGPVDMGLVIGHVVAGNKYVIQLDGKRVEDNEALALKKEVEMIEQTRVWKVFIETLRYQAQRRMFIEAVTTEDMNWGKAILHAIGVFENIVATCKSPLLVSEQKLSTPTGNKNLVKEALLKDNQAK